MNDKQKINCTVCNCKYNDYDTKECALKAIVVEPCSKENGANPEDQSMCGSFVLENNEK